jgi:outer membrane protein OmpA-like peptidoglycan-associated protein
VYFEFNKSNLTPEANAVLDRAVADAAKCNYKTVNVSGNTDTSGSAAYNEGLSSSRAQIVADGLTARGVSASLISQEALGESKPAVATQDGVKEPLNRRTEVVITFQ